MTGTGECNAYVLKEATETVTRQVSHGSQYMCNRKAAAAR
jgi:hypothetical protein